MIRNAEEELLAQHEKVRSGSDALEGGYVVQIVSKVGMNLG